MARRHRSSAGAPHSPSLVGGAGIYARIKAALLERLQALRYGFANCQLLIALFPTHTVYTVHKCPHRPQPGSNPTANPMAIPELSLLQLTLPHETQSRSRLAGEGSAPLQPGVSRVASGSSVTVSVPFTNWPQQFMPIPLTSTCASRYQCRAPVSVPLWLLLAAFGRLG